MPTRESLLDRLSDDIAALPRDRARLVAVDGVDGSGKTVLADAWAQHLERAGTRVVRVSIDGFHQPRAARYLRGRDSPDGFFLDSYDLDAFGAAVLDPVRTGGAVRTAAFDHRTDRPVAGDRVPVAPGDVVLVDGIFLHRPELADRWDLSVFLRVPFAETFARMCRRDGCPPDPEHPDNRRYLLGQQRYLRECRPEERAHRVVDNTDPADPVLL